MIANPGSSRSLHPANESRIVDSTLRPGQMRDPPAERMNSPLEIREVRLRGLSGTVECHAAGTQHRGSAVEALFASRVSARQGLPQSQRRLQPLISGSEPAPTTKDPPPRDRSFVSTIGSGA